MQQSDIKPTVEVSLSKGKSRIMPAVDSEITASKKRLAAMDNASKS